MEPHKSDDVPRFESLEMTSRQLDRATDDPDKAGLVILLLTAVGISVAILIRYFS